MEGFKNLNKIWEEAVIVFYPETLCFCVQGVFDQRMKTWQKWQDSQLLLQKKREAEAKLQFTNKPEKLQQAKDEIKEVRAQSGKRPEPNGPVGRGTRSLVYISVQV